MAPEIAWTSTIGILIVKEIFSCGLQHVIKHLTNGADLQKILVDSTIELGKSEAQFSAIADNLIELFEKTPLPPDILQNLTIDTDFNNLIDAFRKTVFYKTFCDNKYLTDEKIQEVLKCYLYILEKNIPKYPQLSTELQLVYLGAIHKKLLELSSIIKRPSRTLIVNFISIETTALKDEKIKHMTTILKLACEYNSQGKYKESVEEHEKFLNSPHAERHPDYWKSLNNMGRALFELGEYSEALPYLENAYKLKPDRPDIATNLGTLLINMRDYERASSLLLNVINKHPEFTNAHNSYGLLLGELGQTEDGINEIDKAIAKTPEESRYYLSKAHLLSDMGNFDGAIMQTQKAIENDPKNSMYYIHMGNFYLMKAHNMGPMPVDKTRIIKYVIPRTIGGHRKYIPNEKINKAIEFYEKAEQLGAPDNDYQLVINKAICLTEKGDYKNAENLLTRIYNPENMDDTQLAVAQNLMVLYSWSEQFEKAFEIYEKLKTSLTGRSLAVLRKTMGTNYVYAGEYEKALPLLKTILEENPTDVKLHVNIGVCLVEMQRYEEAIQYLEGATAIDPNDTGAYWNIGVCYYLQKQYGNAATNFEKARNLDPSMERPHRFVAIAYLNTGRNVKALDELNLLLKKEQDKIAIKGLLADLHYNIGSMTQCQQYLKDILYSVQIGSHNFHAARQRYIAWFKVDPVK